MSTHHAFVTPKMYLSVLLELRNNFNLRYKSTTNTEGTYDYSKTASPEVNQIVKHIIVYILSFHSLKVQIDESLNINLHKTYNDCILLQTFTSRGWF